MPAVDTLGTLGRWAFAELTEIYRIESDFETKMERVRSGSGETCHASPVRIGAARPASPPALSA